MRSITRACIQTDNMTPDSTANNKRIAKNTVFLYIRSIVIMLVSIFTSRIVLQTLGVDDYGINNVVAGFVGMFSVLSSSLVSASQRFISYELGKKEPQLNRVFCGTVTVHIFLALFMFCIFESIGLWFLNTELNISSERLVAANWVFHFSVITFCVNIISTPYNACIVAHEKMSVFAYIGIYEVLMKLGIVYLLWIIPADKLIIYSLLTLMISLSLRFIYGYYCTKHFNECKYHFYIDKSLFRQLIGFSGWNFLGQTASVLVTQGINMLTNIFFGVALNSARGIAEQLNAATGQFVNNFTTAMNPQITQSHAAEEYGRMVNLMFRGSKYSFLLYWFLGFIIFSEADFILDIWLSQVPEYASLFLRLAIIFSVFQSLSQTLYTGMLATGHIKKYQILMSTIYISCFGLCYAFFKLGYGPEYGYISTIIAVFIGLFLRLYLLSRMIPHFSPAVYYKSVILRVMPVIACTLLVWLFIKNQHHSSSIEFMLVVLIGYPTMALAIYAIALDRAEKEFVLNQVKRIWSKR